MYLNREQIIYQLANLKQLTFEVTDDCNLQCKYCAYGEFYNDYDERKKQMMSVNTAKKMIDYLKELWYSQYNMSEDSNIYISLYGGEPLLNMPFVKSIVEYINILEIPHRHFTFTMTTNGILLNRNIDFLVEHNFNITISLDGDIFKYSNYDQLVSYLSSFNDIVHMWGHYANFNTVNKIVLKSDFNYHIVVILPYDEIAFQSCLKTLSNLNVKYHFFFTTEAEYAQIEHLIQSFKINKYSLHPIFTGGNIDFFEQYIFNSKEDIIAEHKTFKEIFANQKLNSNFFGSLTILPSGDIYANLNRDSLGNIINQEISKIINKELIENTAWREIRNSDPCCKCLYQYLCPPPSNYEITINKHNLCLVTL